MSTHKIQEKSLYTKEEQEKILDLIEQPMTEEVENELIRLQQNYCDRETRIVLGKTTPEDVRQGFTRENFPWLVTEKMGG